MAQARSRWPPTRQPSRENPGPQGTGRARVLAMGSALPRRALVLAVLLEMLTGHRAGAGDLDVRIQREPWKLMVVDGRGAPVLVEAGDRSVTPAGPLGFRTAAGWMHATRAVSVRRMDRKLVALLETTDPGGRRLEVRLAPAG